MTFYIFDKNTDMPRYIIELSTDEIQELEAIVSKGSHSTHSFKTALVLLNCNKGPGHSTTRELSKILRIGERTIDRIKKRFVEEGLGVLERRPTSRVYDSKVDGTVEAHLVKLCCSAPPAGHSKWSLRLLADKMVELRYVEGLSHVTVHKVLKKMNLSPGK